MAFYTFLTFMIAVVNTGVTDCGCFGDAIKLTNWETFIKNVFLMIFTLILFANRKNYGELFAPIIRWLFLLLLVFLVFGFEIWSVNRLPIIDFRPYKIGNNIREQSEMPPGANPDVYEQTFYYRKDGKTKAFSIDNIPTTPGWEFVDRKDKLISKGYEPPIHDFYVFDLAGYEKTDHILDSRYIFILVAYDLNKADVAYQEEINAIAEHLMMRGYEFACFTASSDEEIYEYQSLTNAPYSFYRMDPIPLKTIIRANPGLLLLRKGTVMNKWHYRGLPTYEEIDIEIQDVKY